MCVCVCVCVCARARVCTPFAWCSLVFRLCTSSSVAKAFSAAHQFLSARARKRAIAACCFGLPLAAPHSDWMVLKAFAALSAIVRGTASLWSSRAMRSTLRCRRGCAGAAAASSEGLCRLLPAIRQHASTSPHADAPAAIAAPRCGDILRRQPSDPGMGTVEERRRKRSVTPRNTFPKTTEGFPCPFQTSNCRALARGRRGGASEAMTDVTEVKVLMVGPRGAGKSALANYIADAVPNSESPAMAPTQPTKGVRIVEFDRQIPQKKGAPVRACASHPARSRRHVYL